MKKFTGLYEVASEIFENLTWESVEAVVLKTEEEDVYEVGYRSVGSFGSPEIEQSIACTIDLSPELWHYNLIDWDIDPDLIGTTDLDEDLARDYITEALVDHLRYRMEWRAEELEESRQQRH